MEQSNETALLLAINGWSPDAWAERFRRLAPARDVRLWPDAGNISEIRYAAVWKPTPGILAALPRLEAVFNLGAGMDALLADATLPDVPLVRVVDPDLSQRMAEYVAWQSLAALRRASDYAAQQRERVWRPIEQPTARDVTVGILGCGTLGGEAAQRLVALGFRVAGWTRRPAALKDVEMFAGADGLDAFLARTDILVCLLPLTPATRGTLNASLFDKLRRDGPLGRPVLINAARGGLQVEADIIAALDSGVLGHAVLDVFETEPLPRDNLIWAHECITVTPHVAADSTPDAVARYVLGQIARYESGEGLSNLVDRTAGY